MSDVESGEEATSDDHTAVAPLREVAAAAARVPEPPTEERRPEDGPRCKRRLRRGAWAEVVATEGAETE